MNSASFDAVLRVLQFDDGGAASALGYPEEVISAWRTGIANPSIKAASKARDLLARVTEMSRKIAAGILTAGYAAQSACTLARFRDEEQYLAAHQTGSAARECLPFQAYTAALLMVAGQLALNGMQVEFEFMAETQDAALEPTSTSWSSAKQISGRSLH